MTGLLELAERCETAIRWDRELDALIAATVRVGTQHKWAYNYPAWEGRQDGRVHLERSGPSFDAPDFTASLDAATTLVPEGWNWMAGNRDQPLARAYVNNGELAFVGVGTRRNVERQWFECTAATPALALTAAALRARHAQEHRL